MEEKEVWMVDVASDDTPAPLVELSDGFVEQIVRLAEDVSGMKQGV